MDTILIFYPQYERIHSEVHVRIVDLPTSTSLRDLRQENLNQLVRVSGVVTRRSGVMPQLKFVRFDCGKCGAVLGPFHQDMNKEVKISFCANCESKGPFRVNSEQTVYRNYQKMTLQESPGTVPAGRLPRHREIILLWDLIDSATPGEEIVCFFWRWVFEVGTEWSSRKSRAFTGTTMMLLSTQKMVSQFSRL